jgi:hypothetical protein
VTRRVVGVFVRFSCAASINTTISISSHWVSQEYLVVGAKHKLIAFKSGFAAALLAKINNVQ